MSAALRPRAIPVTKKEIFGWAMFDFANSSYTTVVITIAYGKFFVSHIVPAGSLARDTYWSVAIILSTVLNLILSPVAGAVIDYSGRKKAALIASCLICSVATASLAFVGPGDVWPAIGLIVLSNAAFMLSESFCASFLPELSTPATMGKISGIGWGIGYFGGLLSAFIALKLIITGNPADTAVYVAQNQRAMVAVGIFFLTAALPTFILVKNRSAPAPGFEHAGAVRLVKAGFGEFKNSFAIAARHKILFQFLFAFMVYMAGLDAIVKFVGIFAEQEVKLTNSELVYLFLVLQVSAAAGALGFGWLESRIGPKKTVMLTLGWWILGVLGIYFMDPIGHALGVLPKYVFYALGIFAGAGIGATQASSRTVVGLLAPPDRTAQMFGFWAVFSRFGTILGASFGFVADGFHSRRAAVLLVLVFFIVGALMLSRVDVERGIREAHPS
ncbi:MAG: MFS transporter [Gemmatimonadota bacterium]